MADLNEILKKLSETGEAIHIDNIDPTGGINNLVISKIMEYFLLLTKVSSLPQVPDFKKMEVRESLGISDKDANMLQIFNKDLLLIHSIVLKQIMTNLVILMMAKDLFDETIKSIPNQDMSILMKFIETPINFDVQKGGMPKNVLKIIMYFILLGFISLESSPVSSNVLDSSNLVSIDESGKYSLTHSSEPSGKQLQIVNEFIAGVPRGILDLNIGDLATDILNSDSISSKSVSLNNMIAVYDQNTQQQMNTLFGKIVSTFFNTPNGKEELDSIINDFNKELRQKSKMIEGQCIKLMEESKRNGIFEDLKSLDTLQETQEKLDSLSEVTKNETNILVKDVAGIAVEAAANLVTGDLFGFVTTIASTGIPILTYIQNTKNIVEKQISIKDTNDNEDTKFTSLEQIAFQENLFAFTQVFCLSGYNLQVSFNNNNIQIIGDKISYETMISLISTLNDNILIKMTLLSNEKENKNTIMALSSLQQRLQILTSISQHFNSFITYAAQFRFVQLNQINTPDSIDELKTYFDEQLAKISELMDKLNMTYPLTQDILNRNKELIEADMELKLRESANLDIQQHNDNELRRKDTERNVENIKGTAEQVGMYGSVVGKVAVDYMKGASEGLFDLGLAIPSGLRDSIMNFGNETFYNFFGSPGGLLILLMGLGCLSIALQPYKILYDVTKKLVVIFSTPFVFVYELIRTPIGYLWKQRATLFVPNATPLAGSITPGLPLGLPSHIPIPKSPYNPTGGLLKKHKKTRKTKKNKTKKIKRKKRYYTKHRKGRPTKRR